MDCWLVFQYQVSTASGKIEPHVQGIFDSEEKAIAVCETNQWLVFPMKMNKLLPKESFDAGGYFPLEKD